MNFLNIKDKTFLITGVSNKKSVAFAVAKTLEEYGANILFTVQNNAQMSTINKFFPDHLALICDVEDEDNIKEVAQELEAKSIKLDGLLHSIAFANYSEGPKDFLETKKQDFLQATQISCFSFVQLANGLKELFNPESSLVTVSISSTKATPYGYMGPIKAMLDGTVPFMAKSLSRNKIRVNSICSGPLKTSASAGIPGYIDNYLYAERLTLRNEALKTQEVADTIAFLLSPRSSGINAERIVVDAGMGANYFDQSVVKSVVDQLN
jgi:enoyl-[acyl-carrier protein] reductase I